MRIHCPSSCWLISCFFSAAHLLSMPIEIHNQHSSKVNWKVKSRTRHYPTSQTQPAAPSASATPPALDTHTVSPVAGTIPDGTYVHPALDSSITQLHPPSCCLSLHTVSANQQQWLNTSATGLQLQYTAYQFGSHGMAMDTSSAPEDGEKQEKQYCVTDLFYLECSMRTGSRGKAWNVSLELYGPKSDYSTEQNVIRAAWSYFHVKCHTNNKSTQTIQGITDITSNSKFRAAKYKRTSGQTPQGLQIVQAIQIIQLAEY
ncbi:hypothetical protein F4604DRAFT_1998809 [Suillus subluteus]|nr:hypothetical protein F4604DRAFT_1998809 [Suillus subluteus]